MNNKHVLVVGGRRVDHKLFTGATAACGGIHSAVPNKYTPGNLKGMFDTLPHDELGTLQSVIDDFPIVDYTIPISGRG